MFPLPFQYLDNPIENYSISCHTAELKTARQGADPLLVAMLFSWFAPSPEPMALKYSPAP